MKTLGVLTTIAERIHVLDECITSIESQVDDLIIHMDHPLGSFGKMSHAYEPDTLYFLLDDDIKYPTNYVETMRYWMEKWDYKIICVNHGRVMPQSAKIWQDADFSTEGESFKRTTGRWVNWAGGAGLTLYTDTLGITKEQCESGPRNLEEPWLAIRAQQRHIPIWLVPHEADWLVDLIPDNPGFTLYKTHQALNMEPLNVLLREFRGPWEVYSL